MEEAILAKQSALRESPYPMLEYEEALDQVLKAATEARKAGAVEVCAITPSNALSLLGRVLAREVRSRATVPTVPTSLMDGYAVTSETIGRDTVLTVRHDLRSLAGHSPAGTLQPHEAAYVATGARLCDGATTVIPVEHVHVVTRSDTDGVAETIKVTTESPITAGRHVRLPGTDLAENDVVAHAGDIVDAGMLAVFAMAKVVRAQVLPRVSLGVASTGDELADAFAVDAATDGVVDTNRLLLSATVQQSSVGTCVTVRDLGHVRDHVPSVSALYDRADCDVVVTTGAVSMGSRDFVKPVLEYRSDCEVKFGRVRLKPGKPTTFAVQRLSDGRQRLIFGLPGNPSSAAVCASLFVLPALRVLAGVAQTTEEARPVRRRVRLDFDTPGDAHRVEFHRAIVGFDEGQVDGGVPLARSTGLQRSSRVASMARANALLQLPSGAPLTSGTEVTALWQHWERRRFPDHVGSQSGRMIARGCACDTVSGQHNDHSDRSVAESAQKVSDHPGDSRRLRVALVTVSDRVTRGTYADRSGPAAREALLQWTHVSARVTSETSVPDEVDDIQRAVRAADAREDVDLIFTLGGTGFAPRDVTPEAVRPLLLKEAPGLVVAMISEGLKLLPHAMLSRPVAGVLANGSIIVTLPGKPKAVLENLEFLRPALPHAVRLAAKGTAH